ncbi:tyrosine-type recombinase/integrase [Pseudonocardia sp. HH130630-07]|uniref:tyrosine-type recombinase/integrase n=1 Tax=Pseudonocardia sp. HH130630-07 TaxID=1690815 RepID=UPI0008151B7D|nr:tyrosine-type recombinase/integrase [Pseudonocardia sp. HH130630-07]ANY06391.1 integrase [Pseudonocardia sp. HH130630-07]
MAGTRKRSTRPRGSVEELPSGSLRVVVYAGIDPVSKRRHYLRETVPAGPNAEREAEKVMRRLATQVDERRSPRTGATVDHLLDKHFEMADLDRNTLSTYRGYADRHIRPLIGTTKVGAIDGALFDSFYAELRRCRVHCDRRPFVEHRTDRDHECDDRCRSHACRPLAAGTIRQIHFILSGALKRAVRWRWIATNPIVEAEPPAAPRPNPQPPSATEAAQILGAAWERDPEWGLLVWLVMVTGQRRGELCGIRWRDLDLDRGVLTLARSIGQRDGQVWEKDTKTHQQRRLTLDEHTVGLLRAHHELCCRNAEQVGAALTRAAFVFSRSPDGSTHLLPDSVTQRYGKLARRLGISTTLHKLRHYSATELIAAGVDPRTVAGRLGHGGGGTTTLRVYSAWVEEADQRASASLYARLPQRPPVTEAVPTAPDAFVPRHPFERLAVELRTEIDNGRWAPGQTLPPFKGIAAACGGSAATVQRAVKLLAEWGYVEVVPGHGARVLNGV